MKKILLLVMNFTLLFGSVNALSNNARIKIAQSILVQEDEVTSSSGETWIENQIYEDVYYYNGFKVTSKTCETANTYLDTIEGNQRLKCTYNIKTW